MPIRTISVLVTASLMSVAIAGCDDTMVTSEASSSATPAQQACLRDVSLETGTSEVVVLDSQFSQAGTLVRVGVGPTQAPWQCIAYDDGTTDGIESLVDEGI